MNCGATEYIVTFISIYFIGMFLLPLVKGIQEKYHHKIIILMAIILTLFFTSFGCITGDSLDDYDSNQVNDNNQGRLR